MSDPLRDLLNYAEHSYLRMEAEQLIAQCLEEEDTAPLDELVEALVLAGADSLSMLRGILEELRSAKRSLSLEGMGVRQELMDALSSFGVVLPQLVNANAPEALRQICRHDLRIEVRQAAAGLEQSDERLLEDICVEAGERVSSIARRLAILNRLEQTLLDWFKGLAYEAARNREGDREIAAGSRLH